MSMYCNEQPARTLTTQHNNNNKAPFIMYEGLVCVCCLASDEEQLLDLFPPEQGGDDYSRLLLDCFHIEVSGQEGHGHVCSTCAGRLQDAAEFKRQIHTTLTVLSSQYDMQKPYTNEMEEPFDEGSVDDKLLVEKQPLRNHSRVMKPERMEQKNGRSGRKKKSLKGKSKGARKAEYGSDGPIRLRLHDSLPAYKLEPDALACPECAAVFPNRHTLRRHLNEHFANYGCRRCGAAFMSVVGWRRHQRTHDEGPFPCKHCDKVFSNVNTRMSHTRMLHGRSKPSFACDECGERFTTYHRRANHLRDAHARANQYACAHCDETFLCSTWRARHVLMKHTEARYECAMCDFKCRWKGVLRNHFAVRHDIGEMPYACHYCGKRFTRRPHLKEHLRSHLDDRQYECEFCARGFVQKLSLRAHLASHARRGDITRAQHAAARTEPRDRHSTWREVLERAARAHPDDVRPRVGRPRPVRALEAPG